MEDLNLALGHGNPEDGFLRVDEVEKSRDPLPERIILLQHVLVPELQRSG